MKQYTADILNRIYICVNKKTIVKVYKPGKKIINNVIKQFPRQESVQKIRRKRLTLI